MLQSLAIGFRKKLKPMNYLMIFFYIFFVIYHLLICSILALSADDGKNLFLNTQVQRSQSGSNGRVAFPDSRNFAVMTLAVDFQPLPEGYCFTSGTPLTLAHTCPLHPHPRPHLSSAPSPSPFLRFRFIRLDLCYIPIYL